MPMSMKNSRSLSACARILMSPSSVSVDGSAAILWASADYAKAHGLTARARVVATANMGDCPTLMLNAPVPAARRNWTTYNFAALWISRATAVG